MRSTSSLGIGTCVVCAALLIVTGCGEEKPAPTASRLATIGKVYEQFRYAHRGTVPKDRAEFVSFIEEQGDWLLEEAQADSVDELFVSERDGQPLVILYGKDRKQLNGMQVVVHETKGVDGRIMVGYASGDSELVYEEAFKSMK